jgi:hypothetical protein
MSFTVKIVGSPPMTYLFFRNMTVMLIELKEILLMKKPIMVFLKNESSKAAANGFSRIGCNSLLWFYSD